MVASRRGALGPCVDLSRTLCSSDSCGSSLSRTLCSRKWFRLAVDADRASGMRNLSYSRSHQSDEKKLPGQFSDHAIESTRYFFGPQGAESHTAGQVCLVLSNAKNQFWAGGPLLYRSSRNCKLCKHVKTLCFGRDFLTDVRLFKIWKPNPPISEEVLKNKERYGIKAEIGRGRYLCVTLRKPYI